jgi:hypothetical protein
VKRIDVSEGQSHTDGLIQGMPIGAIGVAGSVTVPLVGVKPSTANDYCYDICIDPLRAIPVVAPIGATVGGLGAAISGLVGSDNGLASMWRCRACRSRPSATARRALGFPFDSQARGTRVTCIGCLSE